MADDELSEPSDAIDDEAEPRTPRTPIVIPKTTRLAMGAIVVLVGLVLLIVGSAAVKVVGAVLVVGGIVDVVVGRRQRY